MQISKYNYILYDANYSYWYNGLTHKHFRLSGALSKKLEQLLDNTDKLAIAVPDFYEKLKQGGFIINDSVDELDIIRQKNDASIHSKDYYCQRLTATLNVGIAYRIIYPLRCRPKRLKS